MSSISLLPEDLEHLATLASDLNFEDEERRSALLEAGSRDFNAVPGSGKTSLLAAKLLLLARKWPHARRGICILSHTNVARDEIAQRLNRTSEGSKLLSYPHYIGTIHGFVNQFLALPMLRSSGQKVDVIDDKVFAEKARSLLQLKMFNGLRFWLDRQRNGDALSTSLVYRSEDLAVSSEGGALPGTDTPSYASLLRLKRMLTEDGVFRHRDMFAYADLALRTCPHLVDVMHRRFPMVFIDEMQDTSWEQESLLNRIFDTKSVMQRFGDVDQAILSDEENAEKLTFPRKDHGQISTSKRFGSGIAGAVASVRMSGQAVVGEAVQTQPPVLLLYGTADATKVISHFGRCVVERMSANEIGVREVKAMSARKAGDGSVEPGRHLVDYWPAYGALSADAGMRSEKFWSLVGDAKGTLREASLSARVSDVRRALLLVLRAAKAPMVEGIRDARALPRAAAAVTKTRPLEKVTRALALSGERICVPSRRDAFLRSLHEALKTYLPTTLDLEAFAALTIFAEPDETATTTAGAADRCSITHQSRSLEFELGTVAGMKGETHAASLVLESYGGQSRACDVALGLQYIAGTAKKPLSKLPKLQQGQMRNLYVAMSRPTTLLCLAANENRVPQDVRDALVAKGWCIEPVA